MERVKKGIHADKLNYSSIIGYVIKHNFDYWHKTINLWIDALIKDNKKNEIAWNNADKLKKEYIKKDTAKFISKNSRNKKSAIILFHLWAHLQSS